MLSWQNRDAVLGPKGNAAEPLQCRVHSASRAALRSGPESAACKGSALTLLQSLTPLSGKHFFPCAGDDPRVTHRQSNYLWLLAPSIYLFHLFLAFLAKPDGVQGLVLVLSLVITSGGAWETMCGDRDRTRVAACRGASALTTVLSQWP